MNRLRGVLIGKCFIHFRVHILSFTSNCHTNIVHVLQAVNLKPAVLHIMSSYTLWQLWKLSHVWLFVTLQPVALQASPSLGFSRQEHWSGLPFPSPGDLPDPGIKLRSLALRADSLSSEPPGKPTSWVVILCATLLDNFPSWTLGLKVWLETNNDFSLRNLYYQNQMNILGKLCFLNRMKTKQKTNSVLYQFTVNNKIHLPN